MNTNPMNQYECCSLETAKCLIDQLAHSNTLTKEELIMLIHYLSVSRKADTLLFSLSKKTAEIHFGTSVYIRGLIEFTNYCHNDCYYCGIRKSNSNAQRYRLTNPEILACCQTGYELGFRTFVLQGGEDPHFTDARLVSLITSIKSTYPDCAVTLSVGERKKTSYEAYFKAGADRFLLRHETACENHYQKLHPSSMHLSARKQSLWDLKEIGFQVGAGFMVGSPFQTIENIAEDLLFLQQLQPHMVGIGPFIPHKDTPFGTFPPGTLEQTLCMLALVRLMHPKVLLPATTALGTIKQDGRQLGLMAGANVLMPNLSPTTARNKYKLYDNKLSTGCEAAEGLNALKQQLHNVNRTIEVGRGDHPSKNVQTSYQE